MRIQEPHLDTIRILVVELKRSRLVVRALEDSLNREILLATGVDVQVGDWELDAIEGTLTGGGDAGLAQEAADTSRS
jgi:hypothetical protein